VRPFRYERAADSSAAIAAALASPRAKFLGGGTNLVDLMRLEVEAPDLLVDVSGLGPGRIETTAAGGLFIGAAVTNSEVAAHAAVRERYPLLARAVLSGASGQVRNLATVGGNLLQRTRCLYFQDVTKPCNKREPGSGCPAREGEHRNLAIIGHSQHCVATHPSDMAVALAALDAVVHVERRDGAATIPVTALYRLPGGEPERDTVLEHGELITGVELPPLAFAARSLYRKVRDRASFAFAVVSVAAAASVSDGNGGRLFTDVRLALGGVAHAPWRARAAERLLRGAAATEEEIVRAADAELAAARPLRDNAYKVPLARNLIVRALMDLSS
jgi:xanthine dehydrogenase YagS FAD-binding subunit